MKPFVSIIIVNWNGGAIFEDCLNSLKKITYPRWELIVVDNGSEKNYLESLKKVLQTIHSRKFVIYNKSNIGFAPANNKGFQKANGDYILLLNNDTKVTPTFLSQMVDRMERDSSIGAMQPKIYLMDQPKHLDNAGSFLNTIGFTEHWGFGEKDGPEFSREREIFAAKGACLLIRREVIERVGLFDESFHSYFEESDFCFRVWLAGWRVLYFPKASIQHKVGYTSKMMSVIEINYYSLRNRISSLYKNFGPLSLCTYFLAHLFVLCGLGAFYLAKLQLSKSGMVFGALWWNLRHIGETTKKRMIVQGIRKRSDKEIFPVIMHSTDVFHLLSHFKKVEKNFK